MAQLHAGPAHADPPTVDDAPAPRWRGARSLAELATEAPLPWDEVAAIGASVAAELAVLHADGTVHGRIRAETVIACPDGRTWLVDPTTAAAIPTVRPMRTAPEVREGATPTSAADVFALGVTLLGLLGHQIERQRVASIDDAATPLPEAGAQVLLGMLADRPEARLDAAAAAGRLEAAARQHPSSVPPATDESVVVPLFAAADDADADDHESDDHVEVEGSGGGASRRQIPVALAPLAPSVATPRRLGIVTGATVAVLFAMLFAFASPESPEAIDSSPVVAVGDHGLSSAPATP